MPAIDFLDWVYPPVCALCGDGLSQGSALCGDCREGLPRVSPPCCETCSEPFQGQIDGAFSCPNCSGLSFHFEFARAAMDRSEGTLELVHRLKYGREIHLAGELGRLACAAFSSDRRLAVALEERWPLVPVPLHRMRQMERQFNQAEEISRAISMETGLRVMRLLKRVRKTETQTRLSRRQRMENLKGAFAIRRAWWRKDPVALLDAPGLILVDDVFTTGSTVDECAKVLRKAGARRVVVVTVMRG
ncbi:ComF family protein [Akkermansiaceae bacterium]|nr:ComF family protein [Akkermansiaceae bacterium]